jgi:hypothetical protein
LTAINRPGAARTYGVRMKLEPEAGNLELILRGVTGMRP